VEQHKKVVIFFDKYLEALQITNPRIRQVNIRRALGGVNSEEVGELVNEWNRYVELPDPTLTSIHECKIVE